jgi:hypothetical protein
VPGPVAFPLSLPGLDRATPGLPRGQRPGFLARRIPWSKAGQLGLEEWLRTEAEFSLPETAAPDDSVSIKDLNNLSQNTLSCLNAFCL